MNYDTYKKNFKAFMKANKRVPTYTEIMELTGFKSKNAVYKLINKLVKDNVVIKDSRGRLAPYSLGTQIISLDQRVSAGFGAEALDADYVTFSLDDWLTGRNQKYMMKVQGDSMKDAKVFDGDSVIVDKTESFNDGDMVVAHTNEGYMVKYLRKKGDNMHLEPANKKYKSIYPTEDDQINLVGKVEIILRKGQRLK